MTQIVIRLNAKTTAYFTADYGQRREDWNKQDLLDSLGWKVSKRFDVPDGKPSEDLLDRVRRQVVELCGKATSYIYQVFLFDEGVEFTPITVPMAWAKNVKTASDVVFINLAPPEPEWVPGEEEEEALLYRGAP